MLHVDLHKAFASKVKPSAIWVYDKGVLLNRSPFSSFASAMEAIASKKKPVYQGEEVLIQVKLSEVDLLFIQNHYYNNYFFLAVKIKLLKWIYL